MDMDSTEKDLEKIVKSIRFGPNLKQINIEEATNIPRIPRYSKFLHEFHYRFFGKCFPAVYLGIFTDISLGFSQGVSPVAAPRIPRGFQSSSMHVLNFPLEITFSTFSEMSHFFRFIVISCQDFFFFGMT